MMDTRPTLALFTLGLLLGCGSTSQPAADGGLDIGPDVRRDSAPDARMDSAIDTILDRISDSPNDADGSVVDAEPDRSDASTQPFSVLIPRALGYAQDFLLTDQHLYTTIGVGGGTRFWVCPRAGCTGAEASVISASAEFNGNEVEIQNNVVIWRNRDALFLSDLDGSNARGWMNLATNGQSLEGLYADATAIWLPRIENPGTPTAVSVIGVFGAPLSPPEELARGGLSTRFVYSNIYTAYTFGTARTGVADGTIYVANRIVSSEVARAVADNLSTILLCGSSLIYSTATLVNTTVERQLLVADVNSSAPPVQFAAFNGGAGSVMACDGTNLYIARMSSVQSCSLNAVATNTCAFQQVIPGLQIGGITDVEVSPQGILVNSDDLGLLLLDQ